MVPIIKYGDDLSRILNRSQFDIAEVNTTVKNIVEDVRLNKDAALFKYTKKFDHIELSAQTIKVSEYEFADAYKKVPDKTLKALRAAKENIIDYHKRQLREGNFVTTDGKGTGVMMRPVERAGIYVPGGKAAYPSSVLMCALPAVVAGVPEIIMTTPAGQHLNPLTLVAAKECGIQSVYKVGGAQAIAAMAYGTESIAKVSIISGPGNIYVAMAKREVFGSVAIDSIAGPSEILIIADDSANAEFVAADMLSQAEHDELALSLLLTTSNDLAIKVNQALEKQLTSLPKKEIAEKSLNSYGAIVVCEDLEQCFTLSNQVAPEHLELCLIDAQSHLDKVFNAGAVFMGHYSPEPLGDYYAGTNHVLPTSGTAKFFSALGVDHYIKRISLIEYSKSALLESAQDIIALAETEGLQAHANTIKVRFN